MGQIVIRNQEPLYCNLQAIQTGGSLASTVPALGEVWMIDSTNASKVNGSGKYDKYIVGDGSTAAKDLIVRDIDPVSSGDLESKEDKVDIVSASGATLTAEIGKYYTLSSVGTLAVTLPTIASGTTKVQTVTFYIAAGSSPAVTFSSTHDIYYSDGFEIAANSTYEVSALWNGIAWIVVSVKVVGSIHGGDVDYSKQYLTFVALEDGTFQLSTNAVNYSLDNGETWTELAANTPTPTVTAGDKIMWKGELTPSSSNGIGTFSSTGQFEVKGNIMSLISGDSFTNADELTENNTFYSLLSGCKGLTSADNLVLPATTLTSQCYASMFYSCTSLTVAPELPADTLASSCYRNMFQSCTSLQTAPELPATTLVIQCYAYMFKGCTSLNSITCLATDISASNSTQNWVSGVTSSGTFTKAASMSSWRTGSSGIPTGWIVQTASN